MSAEENRTNRRISREQLCLRQAVGQPVRSEGQGVLLKWACTSCPRKNLQVITGVLELGASLMERLVWPAVCGNGIGEV